MKNFLWLIQRNLRLYLRDKMALFFSLLASLILLMLYALFLGRMQAENLIQSFPMASPSDCQAFVSSWAFAGILAVSCFSVPLSAFSLFVEDRQSGRFKIYRVCSLRRSTLITGYLGSTALIALVQNTLIYLLGVGFLYLQYDLLPTPGTFTLSILYLFFVSLFYCALIGLVVTFLRTGSAYSSFSSISGTLIGFLSCAYLPIGVLQKSVGSILNLLPFSPTAMLLRRAVAQDALDRLANGSAEAQRILSDLYGYSLYFQDRSLSIQWILFEVGVLLLLFGTLSILRMNRNLR